MAATFEPAQLINGTVRVRNTGTVPTIFAVRVTPGVGGPFVFNPEAASRTVLTSRAVGPGDVVAVPLSIRLPERAGAKAFRVELGEASPSGLISRVIDTQVFTDLADVAREVAIVPAGETLPTSRLTPTQLAAQFQDGLGTPIVSVSPNEVTVGQSVRAIIQIPNGASFAFSPRFRLTLLDANNQEGRTLRNQALTLPAGRAIVQQVDISTADLAPNQQYGLRLSLIDPITSTQVLDPFSLSGLFRVRAPVAPTLAPVTAPEPITTPTTGGVPLTEPAPTTTTTPLGPTAPRLITISTPTLTPTTVEPGGIITGTWILRNPLSQRISAFLLLDGPGGANGIARDLDPGETVTLRVISRVPTGQPAGRVTYGLAVKDTSTRATISELLRVFTLEVQAPAPAPAPTTTAAPTPSGPAAPQLITVAGPTLTPRTVTPGTVITGRWALRNPMSQPISAFLFLDGPIQGENFGTSRTIDPGEVQTFLISARVPPGLDPGRITYGLVVRDDRTRAAVSRDLVQTFVLDVRAPTSAPSSTSTPTAAGIQPGQLVMSPPTAQPLTVSRNQQTNLLFSVRNQSGVSANLTALAILRDPNGRIRGSVPGRVTVRASGSTPFELRYQVPQDAVAGPWSVQIIVRSATTSLINQTFQGVFRVR